jgi:hypothetical protein
VHCPEVASREHAATLLVFGVDNALRFLANLFGALCPKVVISMPIRRPIHRGGA